MGDTVTIGLLMMAFGPMSEGIWESVGALELGYGCLDDSPGPEVLGLMGGTRHTDGSGGGDVGGLRVAYLFWGGLEGTPHSDDKTVWGSRA